MFFKSHRIQKNGVLPSLLTLLVVTISGCGNEDDNLISRWPSVPATDTLETATPKQIEYAEDVQFYSVVTGFNSITKTFLEAGRVKSIYVVEGHSAKAGDVLATMYSPSLLEESSEAKAILKKANTKKRVASDDFQRGATLFKKRLISQQERDQLKRDLDIAVFEVEKAQAAVSKASNILSSLDIIATEDGIVSDLFKREGDFLSAGEPLLRFESTARQKAIFAVPETISITIETGQQQRLFFPALNKTLMAEVVEKSYPNKGELGLHSVTLAFEDDAHLIGLKTVLLLKQARALAYKVDYRAIRYSKDNSPYVIKREDKRMDNNMVESNLLENKLVNVPVDLLDITTDSAIVQANFDNSDEILVGSDITVPTNLYHF